MPSRLTSSISGCSPSRPDRRVDGPVAEPGPVVPAAAEPAVVEHEPLDADLGGRAGPARRSRSRSWSKYDRLPGVEQHRPGARACAGACRRVHPCSRRAGRVEPVAGVGAQQPRASRSVSPSARTTSPGPSSSPPPSRHSPSGVRSAYVVWSPLQATCTAQTSPWPKPKPGRAGGHQQGRVVAGAAVPALAHVARRAASGRRWGVRSRHQRPVRSSSSPARAGTGSAARTAWSCRSPAPALVTDQPLPDHPLAGQLQLDDDVPARPRGPIPRAAPARPRRRRPRSVQSRQPRRPGAATSGPAGRPPARAGR